MTSPLPVQGQDAGPIRISTFAAPLTRDGPGLLLRDIVRGDDTQIAAVIDIIREVDADILVMTAMDWDAGQAALTAFEGAIGQGEKSYPYQFTAPGNSGVDSGLDLDGNGFLGEPRDSQGYGRFTGQAGLSILSRYPVCAVQNLSDILWTDMPGAMLPIWPDGKPFPSVEAQAVQRLSSTSHWIVSVWVKGVRLDLLAWSATPPVLDGPEDRNGLRARDELVLWRHVLDGRVGELGGQFVIVGNANLDPFDGEGDRDAIRAFLDDPRIRDPLPRSVGGVLAGDPDHLGDPGLDTVDWPDGLPGNLRVSYILPSTNLDVVSSGVFWPVNDGNEGSILGVDGLAAGPHRLVWVDLQIPEQPDQDLIRGCGPEVREQPVEFR